MAEQIEIDLEVKRNSLDAALDSADRKSKSLGNSLSTALGVFAGGVALKGLEALTGAIGNATDFAKESIKAFSEQEDALNRLGQALRASGSFSEQAVEGFAAFATELQRTSKFGDEVVISQLALAKSFGASNEGAKQLVQAAANLSATFGGSLEENVAKLGKTLGGEVGRLGQFIPALKDLTQEQLRAGEAAAIINQRFGGAAAAELNTYSGSVIANANAFSDLQEEIGGVLVSVLNLQGKNSFLTKVYQELTQEVIDFGIELARGRDGFEENEASINQLSREYADLEDKINSAKAVLAEADDPNTGFFASLFLNTARAKEQIRELGIEQDRLFKRISDFNPPEPVAAVESSAAPVQLGQEEIKARQARNQAILALDEQLRLEQETANQQFQNFQIQDEFARQEAELQRLIEFDTQKTELEFALKQAEIERTLSGEQQRLALIQNAKEKELKLTQSANSQLAKEQDLRSKQQLALAQRTTQQNVDIAAAGANLAAAVAKDGSKEQFLIQKASAIAQSIVATNLGAAQALALGPAGIPIAATIRSIGALNTAAIVATTIKGFQDGGIVGEALGATSGSDNRLATVRDGELILNAQQQKTLFDAINSGGLGGPIVIQIDGREIARAVRNQAEQGFKIA